MRNFGMRSTLSVICWRNFFSLSFLFDAAGVDDFLVAEKLRRLLRSG